jgi:hypothetical protein
VVKLFGMMKAGGVWPDEIVFTGLLSAYSNSSLVDMEWSYFDAMISVHGIRHEIEHCACMVALLDKGSLLNEAVRLIRRMPMKLDIMICIAWLLSWKCYQLVIKSEKSCWSWSHTVQGYTSCSQIICWSSDMGRCEEYKDINEQLYIWDHRV